MQKELFPRGIFASSYVFSGKQRRSDQPGRREDIVNLPLPCRLDVFSIEGNGGWTGGRLEKAVLASEDLAHFRNVLWVLKVRFWSQEKI